VPNISEGRDTRLLVSIERSFEPAWFLDLHIDPDHGRAVFTLAAHQGQLANALVSGAGVAIDEIDITRHHGLHPHVGAVDVLPVVYLGDEDQGAACAEVLSAAARIGEDFEVPVFLYGDLATRPEHRERAWLRAGGWRTLTERLEKGEVVPDYGPAKMHPTAGAMLAAARPPLVAFNLDLKTDDVKLARVIAAGLREAGGGLPGVRAIGLYLEDRGRAQVSTNVHDYRVTPLRDIVDAVRHHAEIEEGELVGLAPKGAFQRFPEDVPLRGFSPERHLLENVLRGLR
jgi:glutamate formiminotransferase / 5-formyltetrahydrofolate cyclo-ligase